MTTEKEQLEAEIAKRDTQIAELERFKCAYNEWHEKTEWVQSEVSTGIIGASALGLHRADVMTRLVAELRLELAALKAQQLSAGVVLPERGNENEGNSYSVMQAMARNQALDEIARLNPCRVQAMADDLRAAAENCALVMRYIGSMGPDEIDGDNVELLFEDEDGRDIGVDASIVEYAEKVADLLDAMLAAQPTKKESGDE